MSEKPMLPLRRCAVALAVLFALAACSAPRVIAADDEQTETPKQTDTPEDVQQVIDKIRQVILPQQKQLARELIRKYPNSDLARLAQKLLDEYKLYDELTAAQRQRDDARTKRIRGYWDARRPVLCVAEPNPVQITNLTDQPVLYQVKGPSMGWAGPLRLRAGESHQYNYSVAFRRVTEGGQEHYSLAVGNHYVFRRPANGGPSRLFPKAD